MTLCGASDWIVVLAGTLLVSQLDDAAARARRKVVSNRCPKPLPQTVAPNRCPKPLPQTVPDPGIRLRGDLPKSRASSLDWCANPSGDRRECGRGAEPLG